MDTIRFVASIASVYVLVTVVGGCGSDSGGGAGASCASVCAKVEAAHCANDPDCMSQCADAKNATPSRCTSQYDALAKCFSGAKFTCDDNEQSVATACSAKQDAWESCMNGGGEPDAGAGGSGSGGKGSGNDGSGGNGTASGGAGSSVMCDGTVWSKPCDVCIATSCCDKLTACRSDADCLRLGACVSACPEDSCAQSCADQATQAAVDLYNESISCANDNCTTECSGDEPGTGGSRGSGGSTGSGKSGIGAPNDGNEGFASTTTPTDCLPVPSDVTGYCGDVKYKVIYDCPNGAPYTDCVLNTMDSSGIYCCGH